MFALHQQLTPLTRACARIYAAALVLAMILKIYESTLPAELSRSSCSGVPGMYVYENSSTWYPQAILLYSCIPGTESSHIGEMTHDPPRKSLEPSQTRTPSALRRQRVTAHMRTYRTLRYAMLTFARTLLASCQARSVSPIPFRTWCCISLSNHEI